MKAHHHPDARPAAGPPVTGPPAALPSLLALVAFWSIAVAMILALAVAMVPAAEPPAAAPPPPAAAKAAAPAPIPAPVLADAYVVTKDPRLAFVLQVGNRLYPEWKETRTVRMGERFVIGDTENEAVVTRLLPDFRVLDSAPRSISKHLNNPAVKMVVYKGEATVDSSWAFLNFPPHFSPRSFFTFQLKEISGYAFGPQAPAAQPVTNQPDARQTDHGSKAKKAGHPGGASFSKED